MKGYRSHKGSHSSRGKIKSRVSIHDRPSEVDAKERIGDWEIDLIIGKDHSGGMVMIVERISKLTVSAQVYVTDPYSSSAIASCIALPPVSIQSWQRGLNENTSGLLRQYWPKKSNFKQVMANEVTMVLEKRNNRPRKALNDQAPAKIMLEHLLKVAA